MYIVYCILYIVYCILYIVYCILYIVYCILYIVYCILYIVYCILYIVYCILYIVYCILYIVYCILYIVYCILYIVYCILYIVYCILYIVYCILYIVYCILYIVYCILYIVYCILYIVYCILYIVYCILYIVYCILYIVYCILYIVYCILYIVYCILYIVYCILYIVYCILYIVYCILYIVYCILYIVYCILYIVSKRLTACKGAELVAFELTINGKKFVFCTVYRVNDLGKINHESIMNTIKTYYKDRNPRKIFIVGDFNLSGVSWPISANQDISRGIEKLFVDSFEDRGLAQCLTVQTHIKGRTLDILLTNSQSLISSLHVLEKDSICKSDHFPITFEIKTNFKTKPIPKRKIYNFKKANWEGLVKSLEEVDTYIPTITIKSTFSSPWFDSECYEAYIGHVLRVLIMK